MRTYATADRAEQAAVFAVMHKLLCVAQSHCAAGAGGGAGGAADGGRALARQLRHLKQEAAGMLVSGPAALAPL